MKKTVRMNQEIVHAAEKRLNVLVGNFRLLVADVQGIMQVIPQIRQQLNDSAEQGETDAALYCDYLERMGKLHTELALISSMENEIHQLTVFMHFANAGHQSHDEQQDKAPPKRPVPKCTEKKPQRMPEESSRISRIWEELKVVIGLMCLLFLLGSVLRYAGAALENLLIILFG